MIQMETAREVARIASAVLWTGMGAWLIHSINRNGKTEERIRRETRIEATNQSILNWSKLYDYTCNEHTKEVLTLKNDFMKKEMLYKDTIKSLQEQVEHYEAELARINIINGKLWDKKKGERE